MKIYYLCGQMSRLFYIVLSIVAIVACVTACNPRDALDRIDAAEAVADSLPDSAFSLLHKVDPARLHGWETPARYALAYTAAQIKCGIHVDDDSLIRIAVDYYRPDSTVEHMRSLYYLAQICQNANKLPAAAKHYTDAEKIALHLNDHFYLGLIYRGLGDLTMNDYVNGQQLRYAKLSTQHFLLSGKKLHYDYALCDLALAYLYTDHIDSAFFAIKKVQEGESILNDHQLLFFSTSILGNAFLKKGDFLNAKKYYMQLLQIGPELLDSDDYGYISTIYRNLNELDSARHYSNLQFQNALNYNQRGHYYFEKYRLDSILGKLIDSRTDLYRLILIQDSFIRDLKEQSIIVIQRDYAESNLREAKTETATANNRLFYSSIIFVLLILAILFLYKYRIKSRNLQLSETIRQIYELHSAFDRLKNSNNIDNAVNESIASLYKGQMERIDKLCTTIKKWDEELPKRKPAELSQLIKTAFENMANDENIYAAQESIINSYHSNIMQRARGELPLLKERDFKILCYYLAGFSGKTISLFMSANVQTIYVWKTRLKSKISSTSTNPDLSEEILNLLDNRTRTNEGN